MSKRSDAVAAINSRKAAKTTIDYKVKNSIDMFGENVFSVTVMKKRLPHTVSVTKQKPVRRSFS